MKLTDKITMTFGQLKRLVKESVDSDWNWCVANVSGMKLKAATYDGDEPWPGDISADRLPNGQWFGKCQTETREEAEILLDMMRDFDKYNHVASYHYRYAVVSREEFERKSWKARDVYHSDLESDIPGKVYLDKSRFVEEKRKKKKRNTKIKHARFFPTRVMPFPPRPPKGGPGPIPPPPGPGPNPPPPGPPPPGPGPCPGPGGSCPGPAM